MGFDEIFCTSQLIPHEKGYIVRLNRLTMNSPLSVGQELNIPVHHIANQQMVSSKNGDVDNGIKLQ